MIRRERAGDLIGVESKEREMTKETSPADTQKREKPELQSLYKPLGLKAVLAAAMMIRKPKAA
jgi:hypothetical protein